MGGQGGGDKAKRTGGGGDKEVGGSKVQIKEEKRVKKQCVAELHASEKVAEWRKAALAAPLPKAGLSRAPPRQPERSMKGANHGPGIIIPEKNCAWKSLCLWELDQHTWSCQLCQQLKKPCRKFRGFTMEGK